MGWRTRSVTGWGWSRCASWEVGGMAEEQTAPAGAIKMPGLEPVPFVVIKLPDGKTVLRHPDELRKK